MKVRLPIVLEITDMDALKEQLRPLLPDLKGIPLKAFESAKLTPDGIEIDVGFARAVVGVGVEDG